MWGSFLLVSEVPFPLGFCPESFPRLGVRGGVMVRFPGTESAAAGQSRDFK